MPALRSSITVRLLQSYFSVVKDLKTYLSEILEYGTSTPDNMYFEAQVSDPDSYRFLVNTTYVAFNVASGGHQMPTFRVYPTITDMREVLDKSQERLFQLQKNRNLLTTGYRRVSTNGERGKKGMTRVGITNYFVNTIVTALQSSDWDALLQRIGTEAMMHLLTDTNIFVSLPNDSLCQMTGEPIISRPVSDKSLRTEPLKNKLFGCKRPFPFHNDHEQDCRLSKRHKSCTTELNFTTPRSNYSYSSSCRSPAEIVLARTRIFYSRPQRISKTNRIIIGLPETHILNRTTSCLSSLEIGANMCDIPDPKLQHQHACHLSKYIFPRQYGMDNPFMQTSKKGVFDLPSYEDREAEIRKMGSCRTPKRLKAVLPLLDKLLWRHVKCAYKPLLDKVCPSKIRNAEGQRLNSSAILDCISEQSIMLSQLNTSNDSFDTSGNPILPFGMTQAKQYAKYKPRFSELACPFHEVYRYLTLVTTAVIPQDFWGNEVNFKVVMRHVKQFIKCRRFESLTLHHILQGFSISACDWLLPAGPGIYQQHRVHVSDAIKRRQLLEDFIFWYFDSFVTSFLKTNFYITETSAFRNRVLYFRQDDWESMCTPLIERLAVGTFTKISDAEAAELLRQRRLGFSFVRLLPKETGVRPIVNLRRQRMVQGIPHGSPTERSINQILQAAFHILSYEKQKQPEKLGASVFGSDDVYLKLKGFKSRVMKKSGTLPRLFFVKVDVQACFDTIEQTKLLEIIREIVTEDIYISQRYGQVQMSGGRIRRKFMNNAIPEDAHSHFLLYATQLANVLRPTIFSDLVIYPHSHREEILALLEEHITENIVKIGRHYYRQTVGIPQGSILSTLLCSFFYGDLERRFTKFSTETDSVLLRLVDDYLFVTSNGEKAVQFLDMMNQGHPEYGCFISTEKTLTNFDYGVNVTNVIEPNLQNFPWCGYLINMADLSVTVDYTRYRGISIRDTLTVNRGQKPGATFNRKMLFLAMTKSHPIYCDITLNTIKMHEYLCEWKPKAKNTLFVQGVIRNVIKASWVATRTCILKRARPHDVNTQIKEPVVTWLGSHAFYTILNRKPTQYERVLRSLAFELSRPRTQRYKKQFATVVKEGIAGLTNIAF